MKSCELVELAALLAAQGPSLIDGPGPLSDSGLQEYWTASKCRLDRWGRALRSFADQLEVEGPHWASSHWPRLHAVLEEILTSEVLTRVWTAVVAAHDQVQAVEEGHAITHNIFLGHMEARNRVLQLIAHQLGASTTPGQTINQLRRRCERWSDLLVGYLLSDCDVSNYAPDRQRAWEFHESLAHQRRAGVGAPAWQLTLGSLRAAFRKTIHTAAPNADLNNRIAAGILSCYPAALFDDAGLLRSQWLARLQHNTNDAQDLLEELLRGE